MLFVHFCTLTFLYLSVLGADLNAVDALYLFCCCKFLHCGTNKDFLQLNPFTYSKIRTQYNVFLIKSTT